MSVAERIELAPGYSISRIINGLVDRGLLVRRRTPSDRRLVMLSLSERGAEIAVDLTERMDAHYNALVDGLSDEQLEAFASVTDAIVANYAAIAEQQARADSG